MAPISTSEDGILGRIRAARRFVAARAARTRPSFALYLVAVVLFPFQWLSPFSYEQAGWTDVFITGAAVAWVLEAVGARGIPRLRGPHYACAAYLAIVAISSVFTAGGFAGSGRNVLITAELIALGIITADYARSQRERQAIARVIVLVTVLAAVQATIGLLLFYLGHSTSLVSSYSGYFRPSHLYTRVAAGFYSPPLLGSFCVFASAVVAMTDNGFTKRTQFWVQVVLGLLVVATVSRPALAFAIGLAIRESHRRGTHRARQVAAAIVTVALLLLVGLTVVPLSLDPLRPSSSTSGQNPRLALIESSAHTVVAHPLLGEGPGSLTASWSGQPYRAHFTPLNVAATTGLFSLMALVVLGVALWRRRQRPSNIALWSGLGSLGIDCLTQDVEHFRHVWMMLGMADADRSPDGVRMKAPAVKHMN